MKTRSRSLSFLTALLLMLSLFALLPRGAFTADAYSGSGTQSDPYVVTTYDELRTLCRDINLREIYRQHRTTRGYRLCTSSACQLSVIITVSTC